MDWAKIIEDLIATGLTQKEIAERCDLSQTRVSELARTPGSRPNWDSGERLRALHKAKVRRDRREKSPAEASFASPSWMKQNNGDRRQSPIVVHPDRRAGPSDRRERSR